MRCFRLLPLVALIFFVLTASSGTPQASQLSFAPAVAYGSGGYYASWVGVADVNGDGKPDLLVLNNCVPATANYCVSGVGILLGNGDGTFQTAVTYGETSEYDAFSAAVADVNGDGKPDVAVANEFLCDTCSATDGGSVSVLLGNGDGGFHQPAGAFCCSGRR